MKRRMVLKRIAKSLMNLGWRLNKTKKQKDPDYADIRFIQFLKNNGSLVTTLKIVPCFGYANITLFDKNSKVILEEEEVYHNHPFRDLLDKVNEGKSGFPGLHGDSKENFRLSKVAANLENAKKL